jgi:succinoglycan biosynthesis protein ExoO
VKPLVSFIVAAHNVERYVESAVRSALGQTVAEIEVVVVDDGSRDTTPIIVEKIMREDARVVLLRRDTAGGPGIARNLAMEHARGEWLAVLDSDDLAEPERTERLLAFARCTSSDMVADNLMRFDDGTGRNLSSLLPTSEAPFAVQIDAVEYIDMNVIFGTRPSLGYLKPVFSANFMNCHDIRYDETLRVGEDFHLCAQALLAGARYTVFSEPLYRYRVRADSISHALSLQDVDRLATAVAKLRIPTLPGSSISDALLRYARSLERAHAFVRLVEAAKERRWAEAAGILRRPEMWSLIRRFGFEAVAKRVDRLLKRPTLAFSSERDQ